MFYFHFWVPEGETVVTPWKLEKQHPASTLANRTFSIFRNWYIYIYVEKRNTISCQVLFGRVAKVCGYFWNPGSRDLWTPKGWIMLHEWFGYVKHLWTNQPCMLGDFLDQHLVKNWHGPLWQWMIGWETCQRWSEVINIEHNDWFLDPNGKTQQASRSEWKHDIVGLWNSLKFADFWVSSLRIVSKTCPNALQTFRTQADSCGGLLVQWAGTRMHQKSSGRFFVADMISIVGRVGIGGKEHVWTGEPHLVAVGGSWRNEKVIDMDRHG